MLDISSRVAATGPTLGAMMFSTSSLLAPPPVRVPVMSCVLNASGKGMGAVEGPEFGTSVSTAMVVSLARKRSWR